MVLTQALHLSVLALLGAALALFLVRLAVDLRRGNSPVGDFGVAFSAFLAAWMALEILVTVAPEEWQNTEEVAHFGLLAGFAGWMNLRWRWALRRAREGGS